MAVPAQSLEPVPRALAARRESVMPLLLAMLVDDDAAIAANQRIEVVARLGEQAASRAWAIRQQHLGSLHPMLRLPLASLAFPVLRLRPRPELDTFLATSFEGGRHEKRIAKLMAIETR